jgi:hypothetical protein
LLCRHAEGDLSIVWVSKYADESPPNRPMLLSSALAIPVSPAASSAATMSFVVDEYLLRVPVACHGSLLYKVETRSNRQSRFSDSSFRLGESHDVTIGVDSGSRSCPLARIADRFASAQDTRAR